MKKITTLFYAAFSLSVVTMLLLSSCDKMDDIQKEYANREETVYLGKVDSIKSYPGFNKTKLVWQMNADPKVEKTIIYWNLRKDSIVRPFNRTESGWQKDSVVLENLPEGSLLVEFRNINAKGETSLISSATATVWGENFADGLRARSLISFDYDYNQSKYNLALSKTSPGDSVVYSEITYTTKLNETKIVTINRSDTAVVLSDFPDGGTFDFHTVFFLPQGIDTVRNDNQTFTAPEAVTNHGVMIALKGTAASRYFPMDEDLGEWNAAGDLVIYAVGASGELTEKRRCPALAPRATFRDLFFYEGDRFIGIQNNNTLYMYTITNGVLTNILTSTMGTGFNFLKYIPARGFFYSIAETSGELKAWFALPTGTFLTPSSAVAGTGFNYAPYTLYNFQTLMGIDAAGYLWTVPVKATGSIGSKSRMGQGWNRFTKIVGIGSKVYGMEASGDLYVFNNFDATSKYWIAN